MAAGVCGAGFGLTGNADSLRFRGSRTVDLGSSPQSLAGDLVGAWSGHDSDDGKTLEVTMNGEDPEKLTRVGDGASAGSGNGYVQ